MHDLSKLPKWAQKRIEAAEEARVKHEYGAYVSGAHIENIGIKHDENSADAIRSVADAAKANAEAIQQIAKALSGDSQNIEFGHALHFENVKHS